MPTAPQRRHTAPEVSRIYLGRVAPTAPGAAAAWRAWSECVIWPDRAQADAEPVSDQPSINTAEAGRISPTERCCLSPRPSSPGPGNLQIACESTEEVDSVPYMGNRGFAGVNVGVDRAAKLGRDGLLWRSGFQADRGES